MGGGGSTKSTVTQTNLPAYARPYYEALMDRGLTESERDYTPYTGQRLAGQSAATNAGLSQMSNYANSDPTLLNSAAATQNNVAQGALDASNYQANGVNNTYTGPQQGAYQGSNYQSQQLGFGQNGVNQVGTGYFDGNAAQQYMSPYMDAVVGRAQENATRNFQIEQAARGLQAAKTGSFGGSRAAVQQQMALNAHQNNLSDIFVQGQQSAFENAQSQFNADQQRALTAAQANQQAGLTMGQANQRAGLDAAQMNEQSRQYGYGATEDAYRNAAQMSMEAQRVSEQLRQSGTQVGLQGLELAGNTANRIAQMQNQYDSRALQQAQAMLGVGQTQEDYLQQQLDQSYQDFVNQRDSERQNLQFLSSLLQGVPVSANSDVTQSQSQNNLAGAFGAMGGLQALYTLGRTPA